MWLSGARFMTTSFKQCIEEPCRIAKIFYSKQPENTESFKQKRGFDENNKIDAKEKLGNE